MNVSVTGRSYPWTRRGPYCWDLVLMGEPDCHAYIVKFNAAEKLYGAIWVWFLYMPRGGGESARGFRGSAFGAKREVEQYIRENWR